MPSDHYKICVDVPKAENICFIAMPFEKDKINKGLEKIYEVITAATNKIEQLEPYRTDKKPKMEFYKDIVEKLRSAKIVVAVCSPENGSLEPNPNVMYELGMAHALGKATIVITSNENSLPSNIRGKYYDTYIEEDLLDYNRKQSLIDKLENSMRKIIDRMREISKNELLADLIDPEWDGVDVISVTFCSDANVRKNFKTIISYISEIQHIFPEMCGLLRNIQAGLDLIWESGIADRSRVGSLNNDWLLVVGCFSNIKTQFIIDHKERQQSANEAFNALLCYTKPKDKNYAILEAKKIFDFIINRVIRYSELYTLCDDSIKKNGNNFDFLIDQPDSGGDLLDKITKIHNDTKAIVGRSYSVISKLIEVMD